MTDEPRDGGLPAMRPVYSGVVPDEKSSNRRGALAFGMVWRREPVRRIVSHGGVFAAFAVAMQLWVMPLLS